MGSVDEKRPGVNGRTIANECVESFNAEQAPSPHRLKRRDDPSNDIEIKEDVKEKPRKKAASKKPGGGSTVEHPRPGIGLTF